MLLTYGDFNSRRWILSDSCLHVVAVVGTPFNVLLSISSTFYVRIFCRKVFSLLSLALNLLNGTKNARVKH